MDNLVTLVLVLALVAWNLALTYLLIKFKSKVKAKIIGLKEYANYIKEFTGKECEAIYFGLERIEKNFEKQLKDKCPCKEDKQ